MKFRSDEEIENGTQRAIRKLTKDLRADQRQEAVDYLKDVIANYGPVVASYPTWHPLVAFGCDQSNYSTFPDDRSGYVCIDHTVLLQNAFITCPYHEPNAVLKCVKKFRKTNDAEITASHIPCKLYHENAYPVLVVCDWYHDLNSDGTIPIKVAAPLMLEKELPFRHKAEVCENWESMRYHFLGSPHGSRSSLFLNQEAGLLMKRLWVALSNTGLYGPPKY